MMMLRNTCRSTNKRGEKLSGYFTHTFQSHLLYFKSYWYVGALHYLLINLCLSIMWIQYAKKIFLSIAILTVQRATYMTYEQQLVLRFQFSGGKEITHTLAISEFRTLICKYIAYIYTSYIHIYTCTYICTHIKIMICRISLIIRCIQFIYELIQQYIALIEN